MNLLPQITTKHLEMKFERFQTTLKRYWFVYLLIMPGIVFTFIFHYLPIYGLSIAFKEYRLNLGILGSPWVGLKHFKVLIQDVYFYKVLANTVLLNIYNIIFGFSFVILLVLMLNEIRIQMLKKIIQTLVYLPNFLSWVVFAGLVSLILSPSEGPVNQFISLMELEKVHFLAEKDLFRGILVITGIIKGAGFSTILYMASISGINPELYESSVVDGANRFHKIWYITIPRIKPTIAVLLIFQLSALFSSNFEQVYNLYNPQVYETGDVLSTYLYRTGILEGKFEMSTALGLVFSLIGIVTVFLTNKVIKKLDVIGIF